MIRTDEQRQAWSRANQSTQELVREFGRGEGSLEYLRELNKLGMTNKKARAFMGNLLYDALMDHNRLGAIVEEHREESSQAERERIMGNIASIMEDE